MEEKKITVNMPKDLRLVVPTTEIIGAIGAHSADASFLRELAEHPSDTLKAHFDVDVSDDFSLEIVENTEKEVNLVLPYYESLGDIETIELLPDEKMDAIAGGEIIISIIVGAIIGVKIASIVGATSTVTIGATATAVFLGTAVVATAVPATAGTIAAGAAVGAAVGAGVGVAVAATAGSVVAAGVSASGNSK